MQVWPVVEAKEGVRSGDRRGSFESKIGKIPESRNKGKAVWILDTCGPCPDNHQTIREVEKRQRKSITNPG